MRRVAFLLPILVVLGTNCDRSQAAASGPKGTGSGMDDLRATPEHATVAIDASRVLRPVSPLLFGMHIEWVENGNGLLEADRPVLRSDVLGLLTPLRVPAFRFPGGIHADATGLLAVAGSSTGGESRTAKTSSPIKHAM